MNTSHPLFMLAAAILPSFIMAWFTLRGIAFKETISARGVEAARLDGHMRHLIEATMADNVRLRKDEAELRDMVKDEDELKRRWWHKAREMRHGRLNDRQVANSHCSIHKIPSVPWEELEPLPGLAEIEDE